MGKNIMLDIYTEMDWVMCLERQRAEFKNTPKIKVKKLWSRLVHFAEISLQQLKMVLSSVYGPHVLVCMPDNIGACSKWDDG